jgi:hypothetical protein
MRRCYRAGSLQAPSRRYRPSSVAWTAHVDRPWSPGRRIVALRLSCGPLQRLRWILRSSRPMLSVQLQQRHRHNLGQYNLQTAKDRCSSIGGKVLGVLPSILWCHLSLHAGQQMVSDLLGVNQALEERHARNPPTTCGLPASPREPGPSRSGQLASGRDDRKIHRKRWSGPHDRRSATMRRPGLHGRSTWAVHATDEGRYLRDGA